MQYWTLQQERVLAQHWLAGATYRQIADALLGHGFPERSEQAVFCRRKLLGLAPRYRRGVRPKQKRPPRTDLWPEHRTRAVIEARQRGLSLQQVAHHLRLTKGMVAGKVYRLSKGGEHASL